MFQVNEWSELGSRDIDGQACAGSRRMRGAEFVNLFRYCGDDPVDRSDPLGLIWESEGSSDVLNLSNIPNIYVSRIFSPSATGVTLQRLWIDAVPVSRADGKYVLDYRDVEIRSKSFIRTENPGVGHHPRSEHEVAGTRRHEQSQQEIDKSYYDKRNNDIRRDVMSGVYDSENQARNDLNKKQEAWKQDLVNTRNAEGKELQKRDSGTIRNPRFPGN